MLNLELKTNKKVDSLPKFHKIRISFVNFLPDEFSQCFIYSTSLSLNSNVDKCVNQRESVATQNIAPANNLVHFTTCKMWIFTVQSGRNN